MKRYIVIEADTEMYSLFAYEVSRQTDATADNYIYQRVMGCEPTAQAIDPGKFFGMVNSLLPTAESIKTTPALKLVPPRVVAPTFDKTPMELVDGASRHMAGKPEL